MTKWIVPSRDKLDALARAYMDMFDFEKMSLDEWLMEYGDRLDPDVWNAGKAIMECYSEDGGPVK